MTPEIFLKCFPNHAHAPEWSEAMNDLFPQYQMDTRLRIAAFLAETGYECQGYTRIVENLNYSAAGLIATWPKRFTKELALLYSHNPKGIANFVYANRMGNGPEHTGDGWKFRGRGVIQTTGHDNYASFAKYKGMTIDEVIEYLATRPGALESGLYFWRTHGLNTAADVGNIKAITQTINHYTNSYEAREAEYKRILGVLA